MTVQMNTDVVRQAAQWMARLWAEDVSQADHQACRRWREAALEHEHAWQALQQLQGRFDNLRPQGAASSMLAPGTVSRRQLLAFGGLSLGCLAVLGLPRTATWQQAMADQHTGPGQMRSLALSDGSRLVLNTRTRLDIEVQGNRQRVYLHEGELLLDMANRSGDATLTLGTAEGLVVPQMARLALRRTEAVTRIGLYQGSASWMSGDAHRQPVELQQGQALLFGHGRQLASEVALESDLAWTQGKLVAERMPLDRFITELARYRPGLLRGDPALARLQVTGVFSVTDTDLALQQLTHILPVRVSRLTRYWVQVSLA